MWRHSIQHVLTHHTRTSTVRMLMRLRGVLFTLLFCLPVTSLLAQTGKVSGRVTDSASNEPLPGVNVVIDGTTQGSVTDVDGYYTIINVRPGTYDIRVSFIGYTPEVMQDVRVSTDLTTTADFNL